MRKRVIIPFCVLLLLTSCHLPEDAMSQYEKNPFLDRAFVDTDSAKILFFTDVHIGREEDTKGIKRYNDNLISFIEKGDYSLVVSGGDISDDGSVNKASLDFIRRITFAQKDGIFVQAIGNHDRHERGNRFGEVCSHIWSYVKGEGGRETLAQYISENEEMYSTGCYVVRREGKAFLSLYVLDTSLRCFSPLELKWLDEALAEDPSPYRIIVTHDNIISGGTLDQSLFITGLGDEGEIGRFLTIADKGKVSLVLTGHHHRGNILYGDGSGILSSTVLLLMA